MIFADSHTHLNLDEFGDDRDDMIRRALEEGVRYLFIPNIDSSTHESVLRLSADYPENCFPMIGLHPTSVKENYREEMAAVESVLAAGQGKYCAIGEIGIDLYWDRTYQEEQKEIFGRQLDLAATYNLPVVVHTRNSFDITARIVSEKMKPGMKGIFHCFSGNIAQAQMAVSLGFLLGIGGVVTFKNSGLQQVVETIPLEHLLLETDAPFLAPVPFRGKRNESSYIPIIAKRVAELKHLPIEAVAETTTRNALALFKVKS